MRRRRCDFKNMKHAQNRKEERSLQKHPTLPKTLMLGEKKFNLLTWSVLWFLSGLLVCFPQLSYDVEVCVKWLGRRGVCMCVRMWVSLRRSPLRPAEIRPAQNSIPPPALAIISAIRFTPTLCLTRCHGLPRASHIHALRAITHHISLPVSVLHVEEKFYYIKKTETTYSR